MRFISLLDRIEPPFTICIDAPWGDGKTFFVKSVQMMLDARNPQIAKLNTDDKPNWTINEDTLGTDPSAFIPFYFNAWSNDMLGNPLAAIIASIEADCEIDFPKSGSSSSQKAAAVIDTAFGLAGLTPGVTQLQAAFSGRQVIQEYKDRRALETQVDDYIEEILRERADKAVLFIDELDRCRPEYAIQLLGDIKNLFENNRVIVVYSADLEQLANSLEGAYGNDFSTRQYLERFYDTRFEMTPINTEHYYLGTPYEQYSHNWYESIVSELMQTHTGTMRTINRIKQDLVGTKSFVDQLPRNLDDSVSFAYRGLLPVLIFLKHEAPETWRKVRSGQSFDGIYAYVERSGSFADLLGKTIISTYGTDVELDDKARTQFLTNLCALIYLSDNSKDPRWQTASQNLGTHLWSPISNTVFLSLDPSQA